MQRLPVQPDEQLSAPIGCPLWRSMHPPMLLIVRYSTAMSVRHCRQRPVTCRMPRTDGAAAPSQSPPPELCLVRALPAVVGRPR